MPPGTVVPSLPSNNSELRLGLESRDEEEDLEKGSLASADGDDDQQSQGGISASSPLPSPKFSGRALPNVAERRGKQIPTI